MNSTSTGRARRGARGGQETVATVVFRGSLVRVRRGCRKEFVEKGPEPRPMVAAVPPLARPAKIASLLVLAHHVQRMIDSGKVRDRAEVARRLGLTRARISQILDLLLLAPDIQEAVLFMEGVGSVGEHALRDIVRHERWWEQREAWAVVRAKVHGGNACSLP